jgi:hypothetical protein
MDLTVFVPTRGRTSIEHITLNELQKFAKGVEPIVVCSSRESEHYSRRGHKVLICDLDGIGPTRQAILEQSPTRGVVMLDDDIYFSRRVPGTEWMGGDLERVPSLEPMFESISRYLDHGFAHGGISARQGNQHIPRPYTDNIRVNNAHFFDRDVYLYEQLRFDTLPVMEDFYITLSLIQRGYSNRVLYNYCWSQRGSGFKGGCSAYRTSEMQDAAARELHTRFPDYVKVVIKSSKSQHGAMAERTDVNIQWVKAWHGRDQSHVPMPGYTPVSEPDMSRRV